VITSRNLGVCPAKFASGHIQDKGKYPRRPEKFFSVASFGDCVVAWSQTLMRARPARRFDIPGNSRGRAERAINLTVADTGDSCSLAAASIARARQSGKSRDEAWWTGPMLTPRRRPAVTLRLQQTL
jgi:hypothetical protein